MSSHRTTAIVTGIFFVVAAAASIPALALYQPLLDNPEFVLGGGSDTGVLLGALLEVITVATVIGTGVALYPVLQKQHPGLALGYASGRLLEATLIAVGIVAVVSVVTLREAPAGDDDALVTAASALIAVHDWTFLLGPGLAIGVNTVLLASVLHRSGLVPRWITRLGLVGGALVFASSTAVLFGLYEQVSTVALLSAVPVFAFEMCLAGRLIVTGFTVPVTPAAPRQAELAPA